MKGVGVSDAGKAAEGSGGGSGFAALPGTGDLRIEAWLRRGAPPRGSLLLEGAGWRLVPGRVVGPDGARLAEVSIKFPSEGTAEDPSRETNATRDARWREERTLRGEVVRGEGRPLATCEFREVVFEPPCPDCGESLAECRDDATFADLGLLAFGASRRRFFHCSDCASRPDGRRVLFSASKAPEDPPEVEDFADLVAGFGRLFRRRERIERAEPGANERLSLAFPCWNCPERERCYGVEGMAKGRLRPFSFFGIAPVVVPPPDLPWDEAVSLCGGIPFASLRRSREGARPPFRAAGVEAGSGRGGSPLLEIRSPLAAFAARLRLALSVAEAVLEVVRESRRPLLNLSPRNVAFRFEGPGVPRAILLDPVGALPRVREGEVEGLPVEFAPPADLDVEIAHPLLRKARTEDRHLANAVVREVRETPSRERDAPYVVLGLALRAYEDDPGFPPDLTPRDPFVLRLEEGLPASGALEFEGAFVQPPEDPYAEGRFVTFPRKVRLATLEDLRLAAGRPLRRAVLDLRRPPHVPCDVHALGHLLLSALCGGPRNGREAVLRAGEVLREDLSASLGRKPSPSVVEASLDSVLARPDVGAALAPRRVFAHGHGAPPGSVPDPLWREAIALAGRLLTHVPGFSLCESPGDFDSEHPEGKIEEVRRSLVDLVARVSAVEGIEPGLIRVVLGVARRFADPEGSS